MKSFDAIKELWKVQSKVPMSYESIIKSITMNQKGYAQKLIIQTACVLLVLAAILGVWLFQPFFTWTTHLSMLVLCFCLSYFLIIQFRDYKKVRKFDEHLLKPQDFIKYLKQYKKDSYLLNKRNYKVYAFGIGFAFLLILFEMYFILTFWTFIIFVMATIGWFILSYLFFIKEYIKTENNRIEAMISQLEKIRNQLND